MLEYERLEQTRKEGMAQGISQSIPKTIRILKSISLPETNIIDNICSEFDITREEAAAYLNDLKE